MCYLLVTQYRISSILEFFNWSSVLSLETIVFEVKIFIRMTQ